MRWHKKWKAVLEKALLTHENGDFGPVSVNMEQRCLNPRAGTPDLKWQGWSKDFWGFEIFDFGVGKLWQGFSFGGRGGVHDLSRNFLGVFKTIWRFVIVPAYTQPCSFVNKVNQESKFLWLRNSAWGFWGVKFWSRDFIGFYLKPRGFFRVLIFAPIQSSMSLEIQRTPLGPQHISLASESFENLLETSWWKVLHS